MYVLERRDRHLVVLDSQTGEFVASLPGVTDGPSFPFDGVDVLASPDGSRLAIGLRCEGLGGLALLVDAASSTCCRSEPIASLDLARDPPLRWIDHRRLQVFSRLADADAGCWFSYDAPTATWLSLDPDGSPLEPTPASRAHARAHLEALEHAAEILAEAPRSVAADVARILDRRRAARLLDLADPAHDLESALIRISEALSLAPDWERPRLALARALDAAGRFDEMLRHCAAWCSAAPTSASAWVMLAAARLRTNDIEGCADALGTAAELHDDVPSLMDLEEVFDVREAYPELARFC